MKTKKTLIIVLAVLAIAAAAVYFLAPQLVGIGPSNETALSSESSTAVNAPIETPTAVATPPTQPGAPSTVSPDFVPDFTLDAQGLSKAIVTLTTNKGVIKYRFYAGDAPKTSARIAELIKKGFYNGLTFHRVVPGFVIQGGDPQGTGMGGSGQKLQAEFNTRKHVPGTVAMARSTDPNSADSQFYISLGTHPHLDRQYTVFGQVVEGADVIKQIQVGDKMLTVTIENQ